MSTMPAPSRERMDALRAAMGRLSDWERGILSVYRVEGAHGVYKEAGGSRPFNERPPDDQAYGHIRGDEDADRIVAEIRAKVERLADDSADSTARAEAAAAADEAKPDPPRLAVVEHEPEPVDDVDREPYTPPELLGAAGREVEHDGAERSIAEQIAEREERGLTLGAVPRRAVEPEGADDHVAEWAREQTEGFVARDMAEAFGWPGPQAYRVISALVAAGVLTFVDGDKRKGSAGPPAQVYRPADAPSPPPPADDLFDQVAELARDVRVLDEWRQSHVGIVAALREEVGQLADDGARDVEPLTTDELTMRERLSLRYVQALIYAVERASTGGAEPSAHVLDRIERLLDLVPMKEEPDA